MKKLSIIILLLLGSVLPLHGVGLDFDVNKPANNSTVSSLPGYIRETRSDLYDFAVEEHTTSGKHAIPSATTPGLTEETPSAGRLLYNSSTGALLFGSGTAWIGTNGAINVPYASIGTYGNNLATALAAISTASTVLVIDTPITLTAHAIIPETLKLAFIGAGQIVLGNYNLTLSGDNIAVPMPDMFSALGAGKVIVSTSLFSNLGAADRTIYFHKGTYDVTGDTTVPANITVKVENGALFRIATTKTLTVTGMVEAGVYQIFSCTGTGQVSLSTKIKEAYPEWWGAKGDAATDDSVAVQAALSSNVKLVVFVGKTFRVDSSLLWDESKCAIQMVSGKIDATRNAGSCVVAYTSNAVAASEYPNNKLINSGWELEGDKVTYPNSIGLSLGEYNTNHMANINFKNCAFHGFGKNLSTRQQYAYSNNFESCHFYDGTYGIYCAVGGELTKLINCNVFNNTYGIMNTAGEWVILGGSFDYNVQAMYCDGGGNINAVGVHLECDSDADYWLYCSGSTSIITFKDGQIVNSIGTSKTKELGTCVNNADAGIHLDSVRISGFSGAAYTPTYLIHCPGQAGVTAKNLLPYTLADLTHGYLVANVLNNLSDGEFEGSLTDWTLIGTVPTLVGGGHGGNNCCKIQPSAGFTSGLLRGIPCRPGDKIRLSYWILNAFGTSGDVLYVWTGYADFAGNLLSQGAHEISYSLAGSHYAVWTQQWLQPYTPAPPGAAYAVVRFLTSGSDGGSINYIDTAAIGIW